MVQVLFLVNCYSTICWKDFHFPLNYLWYLMKINWSYVSQRVYFFTLPSVLMIYCPFLQQYHILIIVGLQWAVNSDSMSPPTLFFFSNVILSILGPWQFLWILGSVCQFLKRSQLEFLWRLCWVCKSIWGVLPS